MELSVPDNELSAKIKFSDISDMLDKLQKSRNSARRNEILKNYFISFGKFKEKFISENLDKKVNTSYFPIIRLLLPNDDHISFGIKKATMGKLYIRILGIDDKSLDGRKLLGTASINSSSGRIDYADVVYSVIRNRFSETSKITVYEVNKHLEQISDYYGNDRKCIEDELCKMLQKMTAIEQKWIVRIILKKLHLDIGAIKLFSAIHPKAPELFKKYSNLDQVCTLIDSNRYEVLEEETIELFSHIRAMLCGTLKMDTLAERCSKKDFFVETKMDGERFQIHIKDGEYKYFSRRGYDEFTSSYGSNRASGTLTPFIYDNISENVRNAIFDGEMMVWNKELLVYHTKAENVIDVKTLKKDHPYLRPCFCIFDILYLNHECLLGKPLMERDRLLKNLVKEQQGVITVGKRTLVENSDHIIQSLNDAIDRNEEGIVIKEVDSIYRPGERAGGGWYKIKPDYIDGLVTEFDLTIIGGYYNNQKTFIVNFLLGVIDKPDYGGDPTFYAVGTVSQGLKQSEWININKQLKSHWKLAVHEKIGRRRITIEPPFLKLGTTYPDVWINPNNSIVLQIKAAELVKSKTTATDYTLRFPRIISIRDDKNWNDGCTLVELRELCSDNTKVQKIAKHYNPEDIVEEVVVPKKRRKVPPRQPSFVPQSDVTKIDDICDGLEFCVLSSWKKNSKLSLGYLKTLILRHGGKSVENPGSNTFVIIAGDLTFRIKQIMESRKYIIASVDWLLKALDGDEPKSCLATFHPRDLISTTLDFEIELKSKYDEFGDSFTDQIDSEELTNLLQNMHSKCQSEYTKLDFEELEQQIYGDQSVYNIFSPLHGIFYRSSSILPQTDALKLAEIIFRSRGGTVETAPITSSNLVTNIFVDRLHMDLSSFKVFLAKIKNVDFKVTKIIFYNWILKCNEENQIFEYGHFLVKHLDDLELIS